MVFLTAKKVGDENILAVHLPRIIFFSIPLFSRSSRHLSLQPQRPLLHEMPGNSPHPHTGSEREDNEERNTHFARPEENHRLLNRVREDKHPVAEIAILPEVVEPGGIGLCHKEHQIGNDQKCDREDHRVCGKEQIGPGKDHKENQRRSPVDINPGTVSEVPGADEEIQNKVHLGKHRVLKPERPEDEEEEKERDHRVPELQKPHQTQTREQDIE